MFISKKTKQALHDAIHAAEQRLKEEILSSDVMQSTLRAVDARLMEAERTIGRLELRIRELEAPVKTDEVVKEEAAKKTVKKSPAAKKTAAGAKPALKRATSAKKTAKAANSKGAGK